MPVVNVRPQKTAQQIRHPHLSDCQIDVLNKLRCQAVTSRAKARIEFFSACAVIDPKATTSAADRLTLLLRLLDQVLPGGAVVHRPGERKLSFDERWLLSVIDADRRGDRDSLAFLISRRVEPAKRRLFALLVSGLAEGGVV